MITKDTKISKMLNAYPQTLEVLLEASPHFNKLNNKILRKTLATRVNVEQAAKIADVKLEALLIKLNKSINIDIDKMETQMNIETEKTIINDKPEILLNIDKEKIKKLDVRPIIDSGKDPFLDIMSYIKDLNDDEIFFLINSFEPIPLYSVLSKKGFDHFTEKKENVFEIYFFKSDHVKNTSLHSEENNIDNQENELSNVIEIDVRELEPPEPMGIILEALSQVDAKTLLLVHHHREPMMLYPKLGERGYQAVTNKIEENYYKVIITKMD
ncbi:MAG: DUF2249 domain-containing protein [Ignavibacteriales bacterium]|nr:DUF2249 domain-containing protein [Ignavibacteriales bacterium]